MLESNGESASNCWWIFCESSESQHFDLLNLVDSGEHQQTQELYSEVQGQGIRKSVDGLARQLPCPGPVSLVDAFIPGPSWSTLLTLWVSRPSYEPVRSLVLRCFDYLGDAVMKHLSNMGGMCTAVPHGHWITEEHSWPAFREQISLTWTSNERPNVDGHRWNQMDIKDS